jgi:hypothetical protein
LTPAGYLLDVRCRRSESGTELLPRQPLMVVRRTRIVELVAQLPERGLLGGKTLQLSKHMIYGEAVSHRTTIVRRIGLGRTLPTSSKDKAVALRRSRILVIPNHRICSGVGDRHMMSPMRRRPVESDFKVEISEDSIAVVFWPTMLHFCPLQERTRHCGIWAAVTRFRRPTRLVTKRHPPL